MIIDELANSFAGLSTEQAIECVQNLAGLLGEGASDRTWLFSLIGGICLAQISRDHNRSTPTRNHLHIVRTEE
jgi:hypothetical protein